MVNIYSSNKNQKDKSIKIEKTYYKKSQKIKNHDNSAKLSISEQIHSLQILKEKGVLSESEYQEKIDIINKQVITSKVKLLPEYLNLKKIYENELLTEKQFIEKTTKLIADYKEYYSLFGDNDYPEFYWELYKSNKLNIRFNILNYKKSDLYGKWNFKNGQIKLYKDDLLNKNILKTSWANGFDKNGEWELNQNEINIKMTGEIKSEKAILKIKELGSHIFIFYINDRKYTSIKDFT